MYIKYKSIILIIYISLFYLPSALAKEGTRFFIFGAGWVSEELKVIRNYNDYNDCVGLDIEKRIARSADKSVNRIPMDFFLPPLLREIDRIMPKYCSSDWRGSLVIYDPEPWVATPNEERDNIFKSIAEAGRPVNESGCYKFGLAPSRLYLEGKGCQPSPDHDLVQNVDWSKVYLFLIQAQVILSDYCGVGNFRNYATFVNTISQAIKSKNSETKIVAELSLNHSDANEASRAIMATRVNLNGFYLVYPKPSKKLSILQQDRACVNSSAVERCGIY
jgi:hypothetical protein